LQLPAEKYDNIFNKILVGLNYGNIKHFSYINFKYLIKLIKVLLKNNAKINKEYYLIIINLYSYNKKLDNKNFVKDTKKILKLFIKNDIIKNIELFNIRRYDVILAKIFIKNNINITFYEHLEDEFEQIMLINSQIINKKYQDNKKLKKEFAKSNSENIVFREKLAQLALLPPDSQSIEYIASANNFTKTVYSLT